MQKVYLSHCSPGGANESGYPGSGEAVVFVSVDCAEWLLRVPFFCGGMPALQ